jgi:hypothetical protein
LCSALVLTDIGQVIQHFRATSTRGHPACGTSQLGYVTSFIKSLEAWWGLFPCSKEVINVICFSATRSQHSWQTTTRQRIGSEMNTTQNHTSNTLIPPGIPGKKERTALGSTTKQPCKEEQTGVTNTVEQANSCLLIQVHGHHNQSTQGA